MLYKTEGIALSFIRYKESSIIARIYTSEFGIQSYIVNSARTKGSKSKIAFFQPLTLLDLVVYNKPQKSLQRISEVRCSHPFRTIPLDMKKTGIAIFLTEVLTKTLKEESSNPEMFDFLAESIKELDDIDTPENFHIIFLIRLTVHLGIYPEDISELTILNPSFSVTEKEVLLQVIQGSADIKLNNTQRRNLLSTLLLFYKKHIENFGEINSAAVLKEIMSN